MTWTWIKEFFFPAQSDSALATGAFWLFLVTLAALECVIPEYRFEGRARRWPANLGLGLLNMSLAPLVPVSALIAATWAQRSGFGILNWTSVGNLVSVPVTIAVESLLAYLTHVVAHKVPLFWRLHRVHHFDTAVDFSTGLRHHPLELALTIALAVPAAIVFGLSPAGMIVYGVTEALFELITHANIGMPSTLDRALQTIFVTPRAHRIHHSVRQEETDSNYGSVFVLWDRLFGTYLPAPAVDPKLLQFGLLEVRDERASDLYWQLKSPVLILSRTDRAGAAAGRNKAQA